MNGQRLAAFAGVGITDEIVAAGKSQLRSCRAETLHFVAKLRHTLVDRARHRSLEDKPANRFGAGRLRLWLRGDPSIDPHQHRALEANANQRPLSCCRRTSLLFPWYGVTHVTVLTRFLSGREEA